VSERIRFLLDENISPQVAIGLRKRGIDVLTVHELQRGGLSDLEQLQFSSSKRRVIVTHDRDFLVLGSRGIRHAGIAWCHQKKCSIGQLIKSLVLLHATLTEKDMIGQVKFL
jgi:predicted nuclease of predicted toxin-antitoxin system